jgi:hypothetical protein
MAELDRQPLTLSFSRGERAGEIVPPGALQKGAGEIAGRLEDDDTALAEARFDAVSRGIRPATTPEEKARRRQSLVQRGQRFSVPPEEVMKQMQLEGVLEEKKAPQVTKGDVVETGEGFFQFNVESGRYDIKVGGPKAGKGAKRLTDTKTLKDGSVQKLESFDGGKTWKPFGAPTKDKGAAKQKVLDVKSAKRVASAKVKISTALNKVDEAMGQAEGLFATGPIGQFTSWLDSAQSGQLANTLLTIKGIIGFAELRELKESSPTGGALGQVSTFELENLQSVIASLKVGMPEDQLKQNLTEVKNHFDNLRANLNLGDAILKNPELEKIVNEAKASVDEDGVPEFTPAEIFQELKAAGMI